MQNQKEDDNNPKVNREENLNRFIYEVQYPQRDMKNFGTAD
jgi:hypothetical protein